MTNIDQLRAIEDIQDLLKLSRSRADTHELKFLSYLISMAEQEASEQLPQAIAPKIAS